MWKGLGGGGVGATQGSDWSGTPLKAADDGTPVAKSRKISAFLTLVLTQW